MRPPDAETVIVALEADWVFTAGVHSLFRARGCDVATARGDVDLDLREHRIESDRDRDLLVGDLGQTRRDLCRKTLHELNLRDHGARDLLGEPAVWRRSANAACSAEITRFHRQPIAGGDAQARSLTPHSTSVTTVLTMLDGKDHVITGPRTGRQAATGITASVVGGSLEHARTKPDTIAVEVSVNGRPRYRVQNVKVRLIDAVEIVGASQNIVQVLYYLSDGLQLEIDCQLVYWEQLIWSTLK